MLQLRNEWACEGCETQPSQHCCQHIPASPAASRRLRTKPSVRSGLSILPYPWLRGLCVPIFAPGKFLLNCLLVRVLRHTFDRATPPWFFRLLTFLGYFDRLRETAVRNALKYHRGPGSALSEGRADNTVTHLNVVPTLALRLLQDPLSQEADFSSLRCLMNAAAPLKSNLSTRLQKLVGCSLTQWYGMTEASPSVITQTLNQVHVVGSVGKLLPGLRLKVVNQHDHGTVFPSPLHLTECRLTVQSATYRHHRRTLHQRPKYHDRLPRWTSKRGHCANKRWILQNRRYWPCRQKWLRLPRGSGKRYDQSKRV